MDGTRSCAVFCTVYETDAAAVDVGGNKSSGHGQATSCLQPFSCQRGAGADFLGDCQSGIQDVVVGGEEEQAHIGVRAERRTHVDVDSGAFQWRGGNHVEDKSASRYMARESAGRRSTSKSFARRSPAAI